MSYGIIYKAAGPTGKVYIGQTVKPLSARKSTHKYRALKQDRRGAFQAALLDEGFSNFTWEQIDAAETAEELDRKEKEYIAHYDSMSPAKGYNGTDGGIKTVYSPEARKKMSEAAKGRNHSEETKRKIGEALKGEKNPMFGKHPSEETLKKMSERMKGKPNPMEGKHHTEETKKKMSAAKMGEKNPVYQKPISEETKRKRREAGGLRKLTPDNVREVRKLLGTIGYRKIAKLFNVDMRVIYKIKYGLAYAWVKNEEVV
jgi:group I intron endonuclease